MPPLVRWSLSFILIVACSGWAPFVRTSFRVNGSSYGSRPNITCRPGPSRSMSITPTFLPFSARVAARLADMVLLPVPPLKEWIAMLLTVFRFLIWFRLLLLQLVVDFREEVAVLNSCSFSLNRLEVNLQHVPLNLLSSEEQDPGNNNCECRRHQNDCNKQ